MIPRIELHNVRQIHEERSAFARGPKERKLRIVVDRTTAAEDDTLEMLLGFAHHPLIELLSTRSEGIPRLELRPIDRQDDQAPMEISWPDGRKIGRAVWPASNYATWTENHLRSHPSADRDEVLQVLLLAGAAIEVGADAFVTGSDVLLGTAGQRQLAKDSNAMTVESAVALVGLYLRLRNDFTYRQEKQFRENFTRRMYYWVLARELLPSAWRWTDAGGQHSRATGDDTILQLSLSALKRIDHALRARDRLHEQMKLPQNNDTADEALFYLDTFLVFFVSAFDIVAQVAHLAYGLDPGKLHLAGWRREWRTKQLNSVAPQVSTLMDDGTPARDTLDLLALLRNPIHGEALSTVARRAGGRPPENVVLLPKGQEQALLTIIARHGGKDRWGIQSLPSFGMSMQIDVFVEAVLPSAIDALNSLMAAVEVQRLPGVQPTALAAGPLARGSTDAFEAGKRRRVRLLGGCL
jgi:hypothetical protein